MIRNVLFTKEADFTRDGVNNTRNSRLWDCGNPHGTVELCCVVVWCGVVWCVVLWCGVVWCGVL